MSNVRVCQNFIFIFFGWGEIKCLLSSKFHFLRNRPALARAALLWVSTRATWISFPDWISKSGGRRDGKERWAGKKTFLNSFFLLFWSIRNCAHRSRHFAYRSIDITYHHVLFFTRPYPPCVCRVWRRAENGKGPRHFDDERWPYISAIAHLTLIFLGGNTPGALQVHQSIEKKNAEGLLFFLR